MSMSSIVKRMSMLIGMVLMTVMVASTPSYAAINPLDTACSGDISGSQVCKDRASKLFGPGSAWTNIVNTMIFVVGAAATIMIVVGGLRYTLSNGEQGSIKSAKDTILYAVIGIIIAVSAYAIVNFVLSRI